MPDTSLAAALAAFDPSIYSEHLALGVQERKEVLARFPLEGWASMPLERYALGQENSEDTYCWWMEFGSQHIGSIRGGSARKLLIYKHKQKPGWYFDREYANEQEAWRAVRQAFVDAFALAKAGDWATIDDLEPLSGGAALRLKTMHLYFPDDVLPISSRQHLRHFLSFLGRPEAEDKSLDVVGLNRALLEAVRKHPGFSGWSTAQVERFFYDQADPRDERQVVKIAPGEGAKYWQDCLQGGYICVGWDAVGDLRDFESKESFRARFEKEYASEYKNHQTTISKKANEVWTLMELDVGDLVVANRGTSQVLGIGTVVEPGYTWRPDRAEQRHTVSVKWDTDYAKTIPAQKRWALVTVAPVPAALYETIVGATAGPEKAPPAPVEPLLRSIAEALDRKGQVILYGPPGTGKTFHARRLAVSWLLQGLGRADDAQAALARTDRFGALEHELSTPPPKDSEAVAALTWITFHPSYSYEDFVEGFRPIDTGDGSLSLRLTPGVFKRLCRTARKAPDRRFILLIDEINRGNVAKVLGELITLLERDKRGMQVTLPQSKESFSIPPNVFLIGTMNTADRSIKLLDAALRRRFAFIEIMPDVEPLRGAKVGALALDDFLEELNRRVARSEGREKQIGHSFLLDGGEPITEPDELARRFRQEILPLLQEYCYDDYAALAAYIGEKLVDKESQMLNQERLADPEALLSALEEEFGHLEGGST